MRVYNMYVRVCVCPCMAQGIQRPKTAPSIYEYGTVFPEYRAKTGSSTERGRFPSCVRHTHGHIREEHVTLTKPSFTRVIPVSSPSAMPSTSCTGVWLAITMLQYYICLGIVLTVILVLGLGLGFGIILYFVIGT